MLAQLCQLSSIHVGIRLSVQLQLSVILLPAQCEYEISAYGTAIFQWPKQDFRGRALQENLWISTERMIFCQNIRL